MTPTWQPGPPPLDRPGMYLIVLPDGRTGKPCYPMLSERRYPGLRYRQDVLWHYGPIPDPPSPEAPNA